MLRCLKLRAAKCITFLSFVLRLLGQKIQELIVPSTQWTGFNSSDKTPPPQHTHTAFPSQGSGWGPMSAVMVMKQWDHRPCYGHVQPSFRLMADDAACRYAGMLKNQSWICAFVFCQRDWNKCSFVCRVYFFSFSLFALKVFTVDSVAAGCAGGVEDVLFQFVQLESPGSRCFCSPFSVRPVWVTRSLSRGWTRSSQACLVQEAPRRKRLLHCCPNVWVVFAVRREFYSRAPQLNKFQQAGGRFITSAACWWKNWRQGGAEIENSSKIKCRREVVRLEFKLRKVT